MLLFLLVKDIGRKLFMKKLYSLLAVLLFISVLVTPVDASAALKKVPIEDQIEKLTLENKEMKNEIKEQSSSI